MLAWPLTGLFGGIAMFVFGLVLLTTGGSPVAFWCAMVSAALFTFSGVVGLINHSRV